MGREVIVVYPGEQPPDSWDACILAGGSASWPARTLGLLRQRWAGEGRLVVFAAEPYDLTRDDVAELADWYDRALGFADVVMLWWPDEEDPQSVPVILAAWNDSQRVVHGVSPGTPHGGALLEYAGRHSLSAVMTPADAVSAALGAIGAGSRRAGGEREVPLPIWRTESFQRWYSAQTSAGNTLAGARQVWTFSVGPGQRSLIYWALHVRVYVSSEDRVKSNEVVISRPDISVMALYQRNASPDDSIVVLIREFRSTASTPDGFVHELPGGSGPEADAFDQAVRETEEEIGLALDVRRIRSHGSRQLAATVSAHHAHLFTAEITDDELARLRAGQSRPRGSGDTEMTWTEVTTFGEIRRSRLVDWATLGMIAEAVLADPGSSGH
jgi:hypothetical protein